jgi:hypothetical protein
VVACHFQQVRSDGVQAVVTGHPAVSFERGQERESGLRPVGHPGGDGMVERDDGVGVELLGQLVQVVLCLPGAGWSGPTPDTGWGPRRIAAAWAVLMRRLGYAEHERQADSAGPTVVPLGLAQFQHDAHAIRALAERDHANIASWNSYDSGGHYAAHQEPGLLVNDIRVFFSALRRGQPSSTSATGAALSPGSR